MMKKLLISTALVPLVTWVPQNAFAQTSSDDGAEQARDTIIVTARKREESLQDVPVVVSAFDAETLERNAVSSIDELADFIPGFQSQASGTASNLGTTVLRGISNGTTTVAGDQAVAINIDGVQVESPLGLRAGQFDLQQIEVLKGPQSLFFGKNSPGGVISISTADPTSEFYAKAQFGYEIEADEYIGELVFAGPISDTLGFRIAGQYTSFGGDIQNISPDAVDTTIGDFDEFLVRGTLLWEPSETFTARLKATYGERSGDKRTTTQKTFCGNPAATLSDCSVDGRTIFALPARVGANANRPALPADPFDDTETFIASLNLDWEIAEGLILSSTTGYHDIEQTFFDTVAPRGPDEIAVFGFIPPATLITGPNEILFGSNDGTDSFSQEIRLTSDFDSPFNFMIGGYYDNRTIFTNGTGTGIGIIALQALSQSVDAEAFSAFGQIIFDISDTLELSGGARYTDEEKSYTGSLVDPLTDPMTGTVLAPAGTPLVPGDPNFEADNLSPEVTLTWRPSENATFFAAYKQGFKSGSFDTSNTGNLALAFAPLPIQFNNEDVEGFEIGFKTILWDNQLQFNGAAYTYDYTDLQLSVIDPNDAVTTRTVNAAAARVDGIELEAFLTPDTVEGLTVYGAGNYNVAQYDDFLTDCTETQLFTNTCPIAVPGRDRGQQNLAGQQLNRAPAFTFNGGASVVRPFSPALSYQLGINFSYSSSFETDANNDPLGVQDNHVLLNANLGISDSDGRWAFDVIGKNLGDERVVFLSSTQPFTGGGPVQQDFFGSVIRGRQILFRLTAQFGGQ